MMVLWWFTMYYTVRVISHVFTSVVVCWGPVTGEITAMFPLVDVEPLRMRLAVLKPPVGLPPFKQTYSNIILISHHQPSSSSLNTQLFLYFLLTKFQCSRKTFICIYLFIIGLTFLKFYVWWDVRSQEIFQDDHDGHGGPDDQSSQQHPGARKCLQTEVVEEGEERFGEEWDE